MTDYLPPELRNLPWYSIQVHDDLVSTLQDKQGPQQYVVVLQDGKPIGLLEGVTKATYKTRSCNIGKVTLEMEGSCHMQTVRPYKAPGAGSNLPSDL